MKVEEQAADLVLVVPLWPCQPWYPKMLSMFASVPLRIPPGKEVMVQVRGGVSSRFSPPSSRVAYLQQHYMGNIIFGEAIELLLLSWRRKSSQSYDSLCKGWISWCSEMCFDPVSGTIEDVVNFSARLLA